MKENLTSFFPRGARLAAVPSWSSPRLVAAGTTMSARWRNSALYPGYRLRGRVMRIAMRGLAASGLVTRSVDVGTHDTLRNFLGDALPRATTASLLIGTPGPAQKLTVEFRNPDGSVAGYGKYAGSDVARRRLTSEHDTLQELPAGVAPRPLRFGPWDGGILLVTSVADGRSVETALPPAQDIVDYLTGLETDDFRPVDEHVPIQTVLNRWPAARSLVEKLSTRRWPVCIQHGDFAPWNIKRGSSGLIAFDWEFGTLDGFFGLDLAFFCLQTMALIRDADPEKARGIAADTLCEAVRRRSGMQDLSREEADALVGIAALDAHHKASVDGHDPQSPLQQWRVAVANI